MYVALVKRLDFVPCDGTRGYNTVGFCTRRMHALRLVPRTNFPMQRVPFDSRIIQHCTRTGPEIIEKRSPTQPLLSRLCQHTYHLQFQPRPTPIKLHKAHDKTTCGCGTPPTNDGPPITTPISVASKTARPPPHSPAARSPPHSPQNPRPLRRPPSPPACAA